MMTKSLLLGLFVALLLVAARADDEFGDGAVEEDDEPEQPHSAPKAQYHAPDFQPPTIKAEQTHFLEWFADTNGIGRRWYKSLATKEGAEADLAKYDGEWAIEAPAKEVLKNDYGLVVKTKARHHAISAALRKPFRFEGKPLVVQYEVKYEEGQECGGGYLKLLSVGAGKVEQFTDKSPYSVMFGPDKCGQSAKVHFIVRHRNPKNGNITEHHARQPAKPLSSYFDDKQSHLYTLVVRPDNTFSVSVDSSELLSGSLLTDVEPAVEPKKQVPDPSDAKPADWDDRAEIDDPEAAKPADWDESQPSQVLDEEAVKPADWLEDQQQLVPDTNAKQPADWDNEMDGEWEPPKVANPKCAGVSGCGEWTRPMKANPLHKGKWYPRKIANPAYKGPWEAKLVDNPDYFEADPFKQLTPIGAVGIELWTMSSGIVFDNVLVTDSEEVAADLARQTFAVKAAQEKLFDTIENPSQGIVAQVLAATEERPWLWAVFVLALLVPVVLVGVFCFGRKTAPVGGAHPKKTDAPQPDDEGEEDEEEANDPADDAQADEEADEQQEEQEEQEEHSAATASTSSSSSKKAPKEPEPVAATPASPPRKARQRRQD